MTTVELEVLWFMREGRAFTVTKARKRALAHLLVGSYLDLDIRQGIDDKRAFRELHYTVTAKGQRALRRAGKMGKTDE